MPVCACLRAWNASRPARRMRPSSIRSCARLTLTLLQMLPGLRGVKRIFVIGVVNALALAVDPAEAERFVDRLRPGDAGTPGLLPVKAHPKLLPAVVMLLEPLAKLSWAHEKVKVV